jgi:hypothetical protein
MTLRLDSRQGSWLPRQTSPSYQQQSLVSSNENSQRNIGGQYALSDSKQQFLIARTISMIESPLALRQIIIRGIHLNSSQESFSSTPLRLPITIILIMLFYLSWIRFLLGSICGMMSASRGPEFFSLPHYFIRPFSDLRQQNSRRDP